MAEWIKMEVTLSEKPEVLAISAKTGMEPDLVVGRLFRVWRWFDQHTEGGKAPGVTLQTLRYAIGNTPGADEFLVAMRDVGWLTVTDDGLELPRFERHCGATAKTRAETARRVAKHRSSAKRPAKAKPAAPDADPAEPESEPRPARFSARKHLASAGVPDGVIDDWLSHRKAKKAPVTETAIAGIEREAAKAGVSLESALSTMCARGWSGFKADWVIADRAAPQRPSSATAGQKTMAASEEARRKVLQGGV